MDIWKNDTHLHRVNQVLLLFIILCCSYVLILPIIPAINGWQRRVITKPIKIDISSDTGMKAINRDTNRLIIPALQLEKPILEGQSESTVHQGIWRRPQTSTPDKGSNTVLVGHRFTYDGASVFYDLDKVKPGNEIFMTFNGVIYRYIVDQILIVSPNASEIEAHTTSDRLTLYTCTPLWSTKQRLVVQASLKEKL